MNKLRKVIKVQIICIPILAVFSWLIFIFLDYFEKEQYINVSKQEFVEIIKREKINLVTITEDRYEIVANGNKKYYTEVNKDENGDFKEKLMDEFLVDISGKNPAYIAFGSFICFIVFVIIIINLFVIWLVVLFDLLKSEFKNNSNKWIWFISMIILFFIAPIFYLYISDKQKIDNY